MIDFRYHLVSLVSVFLALAVGIVLGAGPLKEQIGDTLAEQVNALRKDRDALRAQLNTAQDGVTHRDDYVAALTPATVAGRLTGTSVILIGLPGAESSTLDSVRDTLGDAGATVAGRILVTDDWTSADAQDDRDDLVPQLQATLGAGAPGGTGNEALSALLARALVTSTAAETAVADAPGRAVLDELEKAKLVTVEGDVPRRATAAILVAPPVVTTGGTQASATAGPSAADVSGDWAQIASAVDAAGAGAVVLGPPSSAGGDGLVATVRNEGALARAVSTVDVGGTSMGDLSAVLALDEQLEGTSGAYGFGDRATAPIPALTGPTP